MLKQKWLLIIPCLLLLGVAGYLVFDTGEKKKSTSELIVDLKSHVEKDRMIAVRSLPVRTEDAAVIVPALIEALKDKQPDIRLSAAIKLGSFGDRAKEAIPALQAALQDRDARVREAAGIAISRIDSNAASKAPDSKSGE